MHTTRLGFGSWAAGGARWAFRVGTAGREASLARMRHAIEAAMTASISNYCVDGSPSPTAVRGTAMDEIDRDPGNAGATIPTSAAAVKEMS